MTSEIASRRLGSSGPAVYPLALGCMGMSGMYGQSDDNESIAKIHAALDQGIVLLDTGDFYGTGHNEMLIGQALKDRRDKALLSVKFGTPWELSPEEIARIEEAVPASSVAGSRYDEHQMKMLDSEPGNGPSR